MNHIAWITLKRNPSNAFSIDFLDDILDNFKIASKDKEVIILEEIFSAGLDLNLLINKSGLERVFKTPVYRSLGYSI